MNYKFLNKTDIDLAAKNVIDKFMKNPELFKSSINSICLHSLCKECQYLGLNVEKQITHCTLDTCMHAIKEL